ncbi:ABC transporter substrate-binding protein [Gleimia sp. 6138-11-ORH1]|uniref:ABC transporter substrate-binding protein n=1 Tax=Gleimia sp. 6138-11-ORH1 TaxID=2973937 RepID=UPI00216A6EC3|nr:ABC transporter substrate-binding protein [Gleimia sp. 6138-11-ORH1]MCS4484356.1 ABC transporter substrate-binding protein [Gleimia sp. 6138-11-ORH1]
MKRKHLTQFLVTLTAGLLLTACTSTGRIDTDKFDFQENETKPKVSADAQKVVIGLTYIPNVQFAPSYIAKEKGLFSENLQVELRHHGADEGLFNSLISGNEHIVIASGDEMLQARSNGLDVISVGSYYQQYPIKVIVKEDSAINSIADLKGKKVGLPGEYGANWFALQAALKEAKLDKKDLTIQSIGYTQLAALKSGQVDAVVGFTNNDSVQFRLAGEKIKEIPLADKELPLVSANIVTTAEYAKQNPEVIKEVLRALGKGMEKSVADPELAVEVTKLYDPNLHTPQAQKAALETIKATNLLFAPQGKVSLEQNLKTWEEMSEFLSGLGVLGAKVRVETAVTNEYLP